MRRRYDEFRARDAEVFVITFDPPERAVRWLEEQTLPFPLLVDPTRGVYRAYGLEQGAFWRFLSPSVWLGYARLMGEGRRPRRPQADPLQLGGDFVVDPAGRLTLAHPARDPTDRPLAAELLGAIGGKVALAGHPRERQRERQHE